MDCNFELSVHVAALAVAASANFPCKDESIVFPIHYFTAAAAVAAGASTNQFAFKIKETFLKKDHLPIQLLE